jgi:hypothetical protein
MDELDLGRAPVHSGTVSFSTALLTIETLLYSVWQTYVL